MNTIFILTVEYREFHHRNILDRAALRNKLGELMNPCIIVE